MSLTPERENSEPRWIVRRQNIVLEKLKRGEIEDVRFSQKLPVDEIVAFGMKQGLLQAGLRSFPDPRKRFEVPIEVILLSQILQRLHNEHSLLLAPYMLNDATLITKLGYNASHLEEGFNERNVNEREAPFHGETLKHLLMQVKPQTLLRWFNRDLLSYWRSQSPGRTRQYILDGTDLEVPAEHVGKYSGAGSRRNRDDTYTHGYKVVWLAEIIDRKSVIVALALGPAHRNEQELAKQCVASFEFEPNSTLICDRGFVDGAWITHLKQERGVDVTIPLKRNMHCVIDCVELANERGLWKPHPTREDQQIAEIGEKPGDLLWSECPVLESGVLSRFRQKDGSWAEVLFVTTKKGRTGAQILAEYDQRSEIEDHHRQLKLFQGIEVLPSRKFPQIVFRILMGVVGYNLMQLFLNSEHCESFEEYSLKTHRQKRKQEKNPKVLIYAGDGYAVLRQYEFLPMILETRGQAKRRLVSLFRNLDQASTPRHRRPRSSHPSGP
jgi:hypothetical protein